MADDCHSAVASVGAEEGGGADTLGSVAAAAGARVGSGAAVIGLPASAGMVSRKALPHLGQVGVNRPGLAPLGVMTCRQ